MTPRPEMEAAIEAVLFVSSDPVPRSRLLEIFDEEERESAAEALEAVVQRYSEAPERGVQVEEVAGGVRLVTRPDMNGWLRRFFEVTGSSKLSMAALETLAVIAYRQPVTGPEIQELRSVSPSGVLKTLLEKRMIRIAGRKEVVGRPFLYTTTREFLVHFGLKSLKDLPPLEELDESFEDGGGGLDELPPEPGLGAGGDREETILRQAVEIEERRDDDGEDDAAETGAEGAGGGGSEAPARARRRGPVGLVPAPAAVASDETAGGGSAIDG
ncbi:MAG TPA: SMC-Scp complex subunit ScpB, partial [Thermoanaerobaculia bacterium]|nr:SMC-Scp complex subunit ScpB [Thermoanaerobaculia bacterium]